MARLEFAILTGARISEALKAEWREVDHKLTLWTIPPEQMKRNLQHDVPLSGRAMAIVTALHAQRKGQLIFPGARPGGTLAHDHAQPLLSGERRAGECHGWRAKLRAWMAAQSVPFEVAESALAHSSAAMVAAYQREQLIELRQPIMERWASYLSGEDQTAEVIPLAQAAGLTGWSASASRKRPMTQ